VPGSETGRSARQDWMAVLARASRSEIEGIIGRLGGVPRHTLLKPAETGTVMIEARAGGAGRRFNLGEATMTRCVVRLEGGELGFSYALGTDKQKALQAAIIDAWLQNEQGAALVASEIAPLAARQAEAREFASRKAARTKVDFFAMVRGQE
jgi:alpha-D-ribose 1-methylphosphonate 5-triphosphate synthase subunit PhnG